MGVSAPSPNITLHEMASMYSYMISEIVKTPNTIQLWLSTYGIKIADEDVPHCVEDVFVATAFRSGNFG